MSYKIFADASCNLSVEMLKDLGVAYRSLTMVIDGNEINNYLADENFSFKGFYDRLRNKEHIKTSLLNVEEFTEEFDKILSGGEDILALLISSGISGTYQAAKIAADDLREKYPERKIIVIDSLAASIGHGLLVYYAAKMQQEGKSIDEVADFIYKNRLKLVHKFTVDDLFFLKRSGRLSGGVAVIGTILQIKPVLHVDDEGKLVSQAKVNGRKKSINALFDNFKENVVDPENQVLAICHGDCLEDAEYLANKIRKEYNVKDIIINYCDPVIGAHAGPGVLALFFLGKER
ncbi:MAG: DegV family protein [Clostridia bacterium]|nr:DegV family protein [Clostridia bacterium]